MIRKVKKCSRGGFALIEVLVSLAILATGLVAVLTAVISALDLQKDSAKRVRAGLVLQEKLGLVTATPYDRRSLRGVTPDSVFTWTITGAPWRGAPREQQNDGRGAAIEPLANQVLEVEVDVSWWTRRGVRSVRATQLVRTSPGQEALP